MMGEDEVSGFKNIIKKVIIISFKIIPDLVKYKLLWLLFYAMSEEWQHNYRGYFGQIPDTSCALRNLKKKGFLPQAIIDCGSYEGQWTLMFKKIFPECRVLLIEANLDKEKYLQRIKLLYPETIDYVMALLGEQSNRLVTFYKMETGSSVLEEQSNFPRKAIKLFTKTLDEIVNEKRISGINFIKLDLQGYELECLKGATQTLKNVEFILIEISFIEYNKRAPLINDTTHFMNDIGFVCYDIGTLMRWERDSTLLQADMLFVRKNSVFRPRFFNYIINK